MTDEWYAEARADLEAHIEERERMRQERRMEMEIGERECGEGVPAGAPEMWVDSHRATPGLASSEARSRRFDSGRSRLTDPRYCPSCGWRGEQRRDGHHGCPECDAFTRAEVKRAE